MSERIILRTGECLIPLVVLRLLHAEPEGRDRRETSTVLGTALATLTGDQTKATPMVVCRS